MPAIRLGLLAAIFATGLLAACTSSEEDPGDTLSNPADPNAPADVTEPIATWFSVAMQYRDSIDLRIAYHCPANGILSTIWGTDTYTDDSPVCAAAVHAGKITLKAGGRVVIRMRPGENSYASTTRNGITSSSWDSWLGSYVFLP